ncbi:MAG: DUF692 family multinuclear iron-containing protein [Desertimonas sp.]
MGRLDLGVGLALMPGLVDDLDRVADLVDCLEVEPQTFWWETGDPAAPFRVDRDEVVGLARRFDAVLLHGVSSPIGGSRPPRPSMVELFATTARLVGARLASEHLAFNEAPHGLGPSGDAPGAETFSTAFFLPPRQTPAGVEAAVEAVARFRSALAVPFSVETPVSYLRRRDDEMDDGSFVAAVAERADCGILLDLHNIWANQRNGRQDARDYVDQLPLDRVWEVHLAGGLERNGFWLDAHSGGLHPDLLALAADVLPRLPALRAVVYEILPEFVRQDGRDVLRPDLETVQRLVAATGVGRSRRTPTPRPRPSSDRSAPPAPSADQLRDPAVWEHALATLSIGRSASVGDPLGVELADDPGIDLLRELVAAGRNGRVASSLPLTIQLLIGLLGVDGVDAVLVEYAAATEPAQWGSEEGRRFASWADVRFVDQPAVLAALRLDIAGLDRVRSQHPVTVALEFEPLALIAAIHGREPLDAVPTGRYVATVG